MTDLTNRIKDLEVKVIDQLKKKYESILPYAGIYDADQITPFLYVVNISYNFIQNVHYEETSSWKAWAIVVIKHLFSKGNLETREDVFNTIDKFFEYKKSEYNKFINDTTLYSDEFYRDRPFIKKFLDKQ